MARPRPPAPPQASSSLTLAQLGPKEGLPSRAKAKLTTHDAGGDEVPSVVTDRPPLVVHEHLDPALPDLGPGAEADLQLLRGRQPASGWAAREGAGMAEPLGEPGPGPFKLGEPMTGSAIPTSDGS